MPFRGVSCSDAAGSQVNYDNIEENLLPYSLTGLLWDDDAKSPYFTYKVCSVYIIFYVEFFIVNCIKGWFAEKKTPDLVWLQDAKSGELRQVWFDDPKSLALKYSFATSMNLRGVGMWNADAIDYSNTYQRTAMWGALPGKR